jgi:hypothetical protein
MAHCMTIINVKAIGASIGVSKLANHAKNYIIKYTDFLILKIIDELQPKESIISFSDIYITLHRLFGKNTNRTRIIIRLCNDIIDNKGVGLVISEGYMNKFIYKQKGILLISEYALWCLCMIAENITVEILDMSLNLVTKDKDKDIKINLDDIRKVIETDTILNRIVHIHLNQYILAHSLCDVIIE